MQFYLDSTKWEIISRVMNYLGYPANLPRKTLHHRVRYENRDKFAAIAGRA